MPAHCLFRDQGPLKSFVDLDTSARWQDLSTTAKSNRTDTMNPPIAQSCHDRFAAVVGYRALGRGKAMLSDCRVRTDNLEERHDRRPYKQCGFSTWKLHAKIMEQTSEIRTTGRQYVPPIPAARVYDGCEA
jgi:hypothetical protein